MSSKKGQSKKIDSARRTPSRRGLAGYSAPRRKTPDEGIRIYTLRAQIRSAAKNAGKPTRLHPLQTATPFTRRGGKRRKVSLSPHFTTPTPFTHRDGKRRKASLSPHFTDGDAVHTPRRKPPEGNPLSALYNTDTVHAPRRKYLTADTTPLFASITPYNRKSGVRRHVRPYPPQKKNLRRPLITPKNTAIFIGFFFYTSPGYAAESPCFRHKHTPSARNTFFAARITICFTIIDFPSCFFFAAAV